jgi:hypothetical protein
MILIKQEEGYSLCIEENAFNSREFIANTDGMYVKHRLSKENCDEIFGVIDIRELANIEFKQEVGEGPTANPDINSMLKKSHLNGAEFGFNKAIELNKDKLFTLEQFKQAIVWGYDRSTENIYLSRLPIDEYLESLQQPTEIEVEIEMETKKQLINGYKNQPDNIIGFIAEYESVLLPKLDENGCLILKKK